MVTEAQIKAFAPTLSNQAITSLTEAINLTCDRCSINTKRRLRYFMAQTSFETLGFTRFKENLMYTTGDRIAAVWPSRFFFIRNGVKKGRGELDAALYVRNPEKLANEVYANRMGNGDADSGDGWRYIGRGPLHLTGAANYKAASNSIHKDFRYLDDPDQVEGFTEGFATAGWFWQINDLNELADRDEYTHVTKIINGSTDTVPFRLAALKAANSIFV